MTLLTTHILDTANGCPAKGIEISLYKLSSHEHDASAELIKTIITNDDGRTDTPLLNEEEFALGYWKIVFKVSDYFADYTKKDNTSDSIDFLSNIPICFGISENKHYHVPLLVSPWSYSTYRGS